MNKIIAEANKSTAGPLYGYLKWISGAIYDGVPNIVVSYPSPLFPAIAVANPKSATLRLKASSKSKFSGFKSLWVIP